MTEASICSLAPAPRPALDTKAKLHAFKQQAVASHSPMACSGTVFVGIFFDGTGNNEKLDYDQGRVPLAMQKQSNIVRLFYTYKDAVTEGTNTYRAYYIPGVGTPFPEIGDAGGSLGGGFGAVGEQRLIWALIQVFNAVHAYAVGGDLIIASTAKTIAQTLGGVGGSGWQRNLALKETWQAKLKAVIRKPKVENIVVDLFGFSRGATQARAFANWLYGLCEQQGTDAATATYLFAGIPLKIRFMGLFDTVASVGLGGTAAGGLLESEGHHAWADRNLQIHPAVTHCEHFVAAHDVRGSFPLDSVRIDGKYPPNAHEVVYPGAHSDVGGGGYTATAQGKSNGFARIPGFAMYQAALTWGVPLYSLTELKDKFRSSYNNLLPSSEAVAAYSAYLKAVGPQDAPVEQQHLLHMGSYFSYRYQAGEHYVRRAFIQKAGAADRERLQKSQNDFAKALVCIAVCARSIQAANAPRVGAWLPEHSARDAFVFKYDPNAYLLNPPKAYQALDDWLGLLERLRQDGGQLLLAERADLDVAQIMNHITAKPLPEAVVYFLDNYIHDSLGGFIEQVDEYELNRYGLMKFRRIFFGNQGDRFLRDQRQAENAGRIAASRSKHA